MFACVCAIANGVNKEVYREPELGTEYCGQETGVENCEQELPEEFEDGKFNFIL
jgi:hypothetical protein